MSDETTQISAKVLELVEMEPEDLAILDTPFPQSNPLLWDRKDGVDSTTEVV